MGKDLGSTLVKARFENKMAGQETAVEEVNLSEIVEGEVPKGQ